MSDAFLQEIIARPDDDAPRLIYADYLEEQGDPRGEFIRLQCQAAKDPFAEIASARADYLLRKHGRKWRKADALKKNACEHYQRGFPTRIVGSIENFVQHARDLRKRIPAPLLKTAQNAADDMKLLADSGLPPWLEGLDIANFSDKDGAWRQMLQAAAAAALRTLKIDYWAREDEAQWSEQLAESPLAERLQRLTTRCGLWEKFAAKTARPGRSRLKNLHTLELRDAIPQADPSPSPPCELPALRRLKVVGHARASTWRCVQKLQASGEIERLEIAHPDSPQWRRLLGSPVLENVRELILGEIHDAATIHTLARRPGWSGAMRLLRIGPNAPAKELSDWLQSSWMQNLRTLHLYAHYESVEALARSPYLGKIRHLVLGKAGASEVLSLTKSPSIQELHVLEINREPGNDNSAAFLANWPVMESVVCLGLLNPGVTFESCRALCKSPHLQRLLHLRVSAMLPKKCRKALLNRFGEHVCEFV